MALESVSPQTAEPAGLTPGTGRADALTTIAPYVEFRVDDILTRHLSIPGLTTVSLSFGVGLRDEPARLAGVTHLVEHLIMAGLETLDHEHNACVTLDTLTFTATGSAEETAAFLRSVCQIIAAPDLSHLTREQKVVTTEHQATGCPTSAAGLAFAVGVTGPGQALLEPDPHRLTEDDVRSHLRQLCRENATLAVVGPLPDALVVPLPTRPDPDHAEATEPREAQTDGPADSLQTHTGAVWVPNDCPAVVLTLPLPADPRQAELLREVLEHRLLTSLRFTHGLSYEVGAELCRLNDDTHLVVVTLDSREGEEDAVARQVWAEVSDLASSGPTVEELERVRRLARRDVSSPYLMVDHLSYWQVAAARGVTYFEPLEHAAVRDAASVEGVRDQFRTAAAGAALLVPEDCEPFRKRSNGLPISRESWCPTVDLLPDGPRFRPAWLVRVLFADARQTLVVTDELLAHKDYNGQIHLIRFDDVAGVDRNPGDSGDLAVLGRNRCLIPVERQVFGRRAAHRVRNQLERRGLL